MTTTVLHVPNGYPTWDYIVDHATDEQLALEIERQRGRPIERFLRDKLECRKRQARNEAAFKAWKASRAGRDVW
jgi:hypothetical protein